MNCVFAHACYGIILDEQELTLLDGLLDEHEEALEEEEEEDEDPKSVEEIVLASLQVKHPNFLDQLRKKYKADERANLHYTGNADEHYNGSATDADLWILGYGCMAFPNVQVPDKFQRKATWHFWVTGEV